MMQPKLLLACKGITLGTDNAPPFQVYLGELVAVVHKCESMSACTQLMNVFAGHAAAYGIAINGRTDVLDPFLSFAIDRDTDMPIAEVLKGMGLPASEIYEIVAAAGLFPDQTYLNAQLTNRLLLKMELSISREVELMIFSTSGLDPRGEDRIVTVAERYQPKCSSLVFVHESRLSYSSSARLIACRCDRMIHFSKG